MAGFKTYNIGDLFDAATGAGKSVLGAVDQYMETQAQLDLNSMQNQFQRDANATLNEINESDNWENWEGKIDELLNKTVSSMSDKESPYYCKNSYTATRAKAMFDSQRTQLQQKGYEMRLAKQREHNLEQYNKNFESDLTSGLYTPQQLYDRRREELLLLKKLGTVGEKQTNNELDRVYSLVYERSLTAAVENEIDRAIENNSGFNSAWEAAKKNGKLDIKKIGADGLEEAVDTTELEAKIKRNTQQTYIAKEKQMQDNNANDLSEIYANMLSKDTWTDKLAIAEYGQAKLAKMTGNKLSEADRNKYAAYFSLKKLDASTTGSGSGSEIKKTDYKKFSDYFKAMEADGAYDFWKQGITDKETNGVIYPSLYVTDAICRNLIKDEWSNNDYQENYNIGSEEREKVWGDMYQGRSNGLGDKLLDEVCKNPAFATKAMYIKGDINKIKADLTAKKLPADDQTVTELINFMRDVAFGSTGLTTAEDIQAAWDQHINSFYMSQSKYLSLDKKGNVDAKLNSNKDTDVVKAVNMLGERDFVYTDEMGREVWNEEAKTALEAPGGIRDVLKGAVARQLGLTSEEAEKIVPRYEKTADDMNSNLIFKYDGKDYKVQVDPENKKKYQVVELETGKLQASNAKVKYNGREYTASFNGGFKEDIILKDNETGEELHSKNGDFKPAELTYQNNEKYEHFKNINELRDQEKTLNKERSEELSTKINNHAGVPVSIKTALNISDDKWNNAGEAGRQSILESSVKQIDKEAAYCLKEKTGKAASEFRRKYGIKAVDWNSKSTVQKKDYVITD